MCLLRRNQRVEVKTIVHWMSKILLATQIAFRGLRRRMKKSVFLKKGENRVIENV